MQKLVQGVQHFQHDVFSSKQELFHKLAGGQQPLALFITCSDSRIDPSLLMQTDPGELFVIRNAGNIVPPYGTLEGGEAATIEYAVSVLGVKDIVVCGHSHCGAMTGLLNLDQLDKLPLVRSWLSHAESTRKIVEEKFAHVTDEKERIITTVQQNVLVQLDHLRSYPVVAEALNSGATRLHAWVYHFESGKVESYRPDLEQFQPIDGSDPLPAAS